MDVLIIEDEFHASNHLQKLLRKLRDDLHLLGIIDSVEEAVQWFQDKSPPDLVFMDIQLADGLSFSIFEQTPVDTPVVFTTAYNDYTLKAFKVNSIDYLLKPIDEYELNQALIKFEKINRKPQTADLQAFHKAIAGLNVPRSYKDRFLFKSREKFLSVQADDIAYFYSEESITFIMTRAGKKYFYDPSLNTLEVELDPSKFFRVNRKWIVHFSSIKQIFPYFNNRLKLELIHARKEDVIVSREKVKDFKSWMGA